MFCFAGVHNGTSSVILLCMWLTSKVWYKYHLHNMLLFVYKIVQAKKATNKPLLNKTKQLPWMASAAADGVMPQSQSLHFFHLVEWIILPTMNFGKSLFRKLFFYTYWWKLTFCESSFVDRYREVFHLETTFSISGKPAKVQLNENFAASISLTKFFHIYD